MTTASPTFQPRLAPLCAGLPRDRGFIVPTRRAVWLVLAAAAPLALVSFWPELAYPALVWDAALLALIAGEGLALRRWVDLEVHRVAPRTFSLGEVHGVHIRVLSRTTFAVRVRIDDDLPEAIVATSPAHTELALRPHGTAAGRYEVRAEHRGDHAFGPLSLRVCGPLGLAAVVSRVDAPLRARVLPSLKGLRRLELAARFIEKSSGFRSMRREGAGDEFEKLREYLPDDDFRHIDWKATARRRRPVTRVFEAQRNQLVLICIETGRGMSSRVGQLAKLDHAINSALLLAYAAQRMGDQVGLVLFSDEVETFLAPKRGAAQFRRILRALYAAKASPTFVDYREMLRTVRTFVSRRSLLVFFTDVVGHDEMQPLVADVRRLARRHLPMLVAMDAPAIREATHAEPSHVEDAYVLAAASEHLQAREALLREFRGAGGLVVEAPPERVGAALVNRYLELKRTRRV